MIKLQSFIVRSDELTRSEFYDYWLNEHVPLAKDLAGLRRYRTALPVEPFMSRYDGVAELYFDTIEAFESALGPESNTPAINDVDNFENRTDRCLVTETVRYDERTEGSPVKLVAVLSRRDNVRHNAFVDGCFNDETFEQVPGLRKFTTAVPVAADVSYDGVIECYFDGVDELHAAMIPDDADSTLEAIDLPFDTSLVGSVDSHVVRETVQLDNIA
ncbi:EthD domain-containing protein [Natronosalvus halobius]|uniref:EthD domain-containing protein n=1 Tax=Natronosalvus halobius TaxID=2953746 RepID=UPI00209F8BD4|nr:EthD domain-containing protein [Natronosalvus halobius]USZ73703.1 EthD family reductase [Natronosalvus halobius]